MQGQDGWVDGWMDEIALTSLLHMQVSNRQEDQHSCEVTCTYSTG